MSVQRSEIYFVNLNPVQGREQAGDLLSIRFVTLQEAG
jgi:mRNA-degrading endonuclease toxin of MazEF toxin-antitoxin module